MEYEEFKKNYSWHIEHHNGDDSEIRELYEEKVARPAREKQAIKDSEIEFAQKAINHIGEDAFMEAMEEAGTKKARIDRIKAGETGLTEIEKDCVQHQIDIS